MSLRKTMTTTRKIPMKIHSRYINERVQREKIKVGLTITIDNEEVDN